MFWLVHFHISPCLVLCRSCLQFWQQCACHFTFKIYWVSHECYVWIISICHNQHSYSRVPCQICMHCRRWDFCFFFLLVGWHMCFLRIQYRGKQYSLHMVLRCIKCFFYLPHPITQMFGFLHTSKSFEFCSFNLPG